MHSFKALSAPSLPNFLARAQHILTGEAHLFRSVLHLAYNVNYILLLFAVPRNVLVVYLAYCGALLAFSAPLIAWQIGKTTKLLL